MPGKYLRHPEFINSACGSFAKKKKKKRSMRFKIYLSKRIKQSLFLTWYGLWSF